MKAERPWDSPWDFLRQTMTSGRFVPFLSPGGLPLKARNSIAREASECSAAW